MHCVQRSSSLIYTVQGAGLCQTDSSLRTQSWREMAKIMVFHIREAQQSTLTASTYQPYVSHRTKPSQGNKRGVVAALLLGSGRSALGARTLIRISITKADGQLGCEDLYLRPAHLLCSLLKQAYALRLTVPLRKLCLQYVTG